MVYSGGIWSLLNASGQTEYFTNVLITSGPWIVGAYGSAPGGASSLVPQAGGSLVVGGNWVFTNLNAVNVSLIGQLTGTFGGTGTGTFTGNYNGTGNITNAQYALNGSSGGNIVTNNATNIVLNTPTVVGGLTGNVTGNLTGNVTGNVMGPSTYATNDYPLDPVVAYYASLALTNPTVAVLQDLDGFMKSIRTTGEFPFWVDTMVLKTNYGPTTNKFVSMAGRAATGFVPAWTPWGSVWTNSSATFVKLPLAGYDLRTNTVFATWRRQGMYAYPGVGPGMLAGLWTDQNNGYWINQAGIITINSRTNGTDTGSTVSKISGAYVNSPWYANEFQDSLVHSIALSQAGSNVTVYLDGIQCSLGAGLGANEVFSSPVSNLWIGAAPDGTDPLGVQWQCEVEQVSVFSTNLSAPQVRDVERALRWFEPSTVNVYFVGDSTGCPDGTANGVTYTNFLAECLGNWGTWAYDGPRIFVDCSSGQTLSSFAPGQANAITISNRLYASSPVQGKVKSGIVINTMGVNDAGTGVSSLTYSNAFVQISAVERAAGAKVWITTIPYSGTNVQMMSSQNELIRQTNNAWLRANPALYDALVDKEELFTPNMFNNTNYWTYDGYHTRTAGTFLLANQLYDMLTGLPEMVQVAVNTNGNVVAAVNTDGLVGNGAGLTNIQQFVSYTGHAQGQTNLQNNTGTMVTVYAVVTNAVMVAGGVGSGLDLMCGQGLPWTTVLGTAMACGSVGTNTTMLVGCVSNGWWYGFTNRGVGAATSTTNYLRTGSVYIKYP